MTPRRITDRRSVAGAAPQQLSNPRDRTTRPRSTATCGYGRSVAVEFYEKADRQEPIRGEPCVVYGQLVQRLKMQVRRVVHIQRIVGDADVPTRLAIVVSQWIEPLHERMRRARRVR